MPMIRPATDAELPLVAELIRAAFAEYANRLDPPSSAHTQSAQRLRTELADGGALLLLIEAEPVGCVCYHERADSVYLDRLAVLPARRGQGLASALITAVEQHALAVGKPVVRLSVRLAQERNLAFYTRLGYEFEAYGTHPGYAAPTFAKLVRRLAVD